MTRPARKSARPPSVQTGNPTRQTNMRARLNGQGCAVSTVLERRLPCRQSLYARTGTRRNALSCRIWRAPADDGMSSHPGYAGDLGTGPLSGSKVSSDQSPTPPTSPQPSREGATVLRSDHAPKEQRPREAPDTKL